MSEAPDDGEKDHEPTQKRLDDARRRGDILRAPELNVAAGYAGILLTAVTLGGATVTALGDTGMVLLGQADRLAPLLVAGEAGPVGGLIASVGLAALPWLAAPMLAVLALLLALRGIVFAPEKLMPDLKRISPLGNATQKFGRAGLFEFAKNFAKLALVSVLLGLFLASRMPAILTAQNLPAAMSGALLADLLVDFLVLVLGIALVMGLADILWQQAERMRRLRMTRQEVIEEYKASEGDPHMKGRRRQRGREIAMNRMLADVARADVVIVNPTHFAVALKWERGSGRAPVCVGKGVDEIAARIRAAAAEAGVPLHSDPPTARALYATVGIGREIRPDQYKAVAAAIRFAEAMRRRARDRWGGSGG
ncbi:flagellar biosynthesis protein FlhB [Frigidibacter sp.]|uniref:EscU/YscU/HrcU family type III secretion system export apparatus switch protein n=1 Tax=Frigidibacter sp. TaxID=2586418 RepID=UPI0027365FDD|nr:flagellar type III secretion system protein FlhB [Frigidibacter sp.]MDP3341322.1 flagellar type III secretion system protein FlhB [Frigidibacter sp.]